MNLIWLILLGAIFFYISKNFKNYIKNNPYAAGAQPIHNLNYEAVLSSEPGIIIALTAKVAKSDGVISSLEAEIISSTLDDLAKLSPQASELRAVLKRIFDQEKNNNENLQELAEKFGKLTQNAYKKRIKILEYLLNLAYIDGVLSEGEERTIDAIAYYFGIEKEDYFATFEAFKNYYDNRQNTHQAKQTASKSDYELLGASEDEDLTSISKKYKALVKKYHPDIISGQGLDQDFVELATKKLQDINSAYENIKKTKASK